MNKNLRRAGAAFASLTASLAVAFSYAQPAMATQYDCPNGYFCVWTDDYGWGTRAQYTPTGGGRGTDLPNATFDGANGHVESIFNRTSVYWTVYDNPDCYESGWLRSIAPGQYVPTTDGSDWDNRISSIAADNYRNRVPC
jgi:hypothetical protein